MSHTYFGKDSLKSRLGDKICPPQDDIRIGTKSLNWFREQKCNLIIVENKMPEIAWAQSNINSLWGNAQDPESLLDFLTSELESGRPADKLYVHQERDLTNAYCMHTRMSHTVSVGKT